jgi:polysaccharide biosynthesis protein PslH
MEEKQIFHGAPDCMIRILSIVWFKVLPPVFGGQKGIALFNKYLALHFPVSCICSENNDGAAATNYRTIPVLPAGKWQLVNPFCWRKIVQVLKAERSTHIILEHPYHGIAGWLGKKIGGAKLIVHSHNIEYLRFRQQKKWWWRLMSGYERWTHRNADLSFFKTEEDLSQALAQFGLAGEKCFIVPYGIERTAPVNKEQCSSVIRQRHNIASSEKILLFAGTLDYEPNAEAVRAIVEKIIPQLETTRSFSFRIIICGRNRFPSFQYLKNLRHPQLIMAGEVTDIDMYFGAADVFINPVTAGGGVQTKIVDALGQHCSVVCFEHMLTGIPVHTAGEKLFVAKKDDWEEFVKQIERVSHFNNTTPDAFFESMSWKKIAGEAAERIRKL